MSIFISCMWRKLPLWPCALVEEGRMTKKWAVRTISVAGHWNKLLNDKLMDGPSPSTIEKWIPMVPTRGHWDCNNIFLDFITSCINELSGNYIHIDNAHYLGHDRVGWTMHRQCLRFSSGRCLRLYITSPSRPIIMLSDDCRSYHYLTRRHLVFDTLSSTWWSVSQLTKSKKTRNQCFWTGCPLATSHTIAGSGLVVAHQDNWFMLEKQVGDGFQVKLPRAFATKRRFYPKQLIIAHLPFWLIFRWLPRSQEE